MTPNDKESAELRDVTPLNFGKYRGKKPHEVAGFDAAYIVWMYDNVSPKHCSKELRDACDMACRERDDEDGITEFDLGVNGWG